MSWSHQSALSQSEEISSDFCCFYGDGIRHNEDIMHSFQNFIVRLIPNHPPPLETRIWKLVVRALTPISGTKCDQAVLQITNKKQNAIFPVYMKPQNMKIIANYQSIVYLPNSHIIIYKKYIYLDGA